MSELSLKKKLSVCDWFDFYGGIIKKRKEKWLIWCGPYQKTKDEPDDKPREAYLRISIITPSQV